MVLSTCHQGIKETLCFNFQTMMVTETVVKKLKIKIGSKTVGTRCEIDAHENEAKININNDTQSRQKSLDDKNKPGMNIKFKLPVPVPANSNKRGPQATVDAEKVKRRKMDRSIKQQCGTILEGLMTHKLGWAFLKPVDPVAFNIPDYFDIITNPMDLGTIKSKLRNNLYSTIEEFAADIRLVFANCMRYNPPMNEFHVMAKELNCFFNKKWKVMEAKWKSKSRTGEHSCLLNPNGNDSQDANKYCHRKTPLHVSLMTTKRLMRVEDKHELKKELSELLRGKVIDTMQSALQKFGLAVMGKGNLKVDLDMLDDETLWELKRVLNAALDARDIRAESAEVTQHVLSGKTSHKDTKLSVSSVDPKVDSCGSPCKCCPQEIGSQKEVEIPSFDHSSCATTTATGCASLVDAQLSPTKALRAAMLKSRFAETIFKANHKDDVVDPSKLQQEKEKLQKQQLAEKARIEEQIKAAETSARMRVETELKIQREREREAARIALEKMERTVDLDDNLKILKDLEKLCQCPRSNDILVYGVGVNLSEARNPLERLGLYIKEEILQEEEAVLNEDGEEGEILV
ncbi:unnamed protein product [Cuscuta epithymum]|uniref:Bromo domain-containing protein n=2 Tax=Cuscuta epithymum TaxID=186058 RepID=A0AAV0ED81_9ASTE|nr:unnamed protein product [Cuscuta epithymum]